MSSSSTFRALAFTICGTAMSLAISATVNAQGNISMLGFGYPTGGMSTRVSGTAGALAEFDALTPQNPASLVRISRSAFAAQAEPEYRTFSLSSAKESSTIPRLQLLALGLRVSSHAVVSLSAANFLDRSYSTISKGSATIEGQALPTSDITVVKGSISDLRAGVGYALSPRLSIGVAAHAFTGSNKLDLTRRFADTLLFGSVRDTSAIDFFGSAFSLGAQLSIPHGFMASTSYRKGLGIDGESRNSSIKHATIPDRLSGGLMYTGIAGSAFAINVEHINWTSMAALGSSNVQAHDATNWSFGAEISAGKIHGSPVLLRAGTGHTQLPFGANNGLASETRFGGGIALPISAAGREPAVIDFSLQRANRKLTGSDAKESAWLLGLGLQIRP